MGIVVAAAGTAAGGLAGSAIMGKGKKAPPGGGIPGLTTSIGSGKDGSQGATVQVDPTIALDYFKKAADVQKTGYGEALTYYGPALKKAGNEITQGFQQANTSLQPLSYSSNQALNEQMRMLGLDPIQATASYGSALRTGIQMVGDNKEITTYGNRLANMMDEATTLRDPQARAEAKARILASIKGAKSAFIDPLQEQLDNTGSVVSRAGPSPEMQWWESQLATMPETTALDPRIQAKKRELAAENARLDQEYAKNKAADLAARRDPIKAQIDTMKTYVDELEAMGQDFALNYTPEFDAGYTPSQITAKIAQTPGYQFQLEQGSKGIERKAAATGMVQSANTQAALQEFGQNQAMSYYNNYLQQLSGVTAQGAGATMQISANQASQGSALGQLAQLYGQAQMDTYRNIANYQAQNLADQGTLFNETAKFNAGLQFAQKQNDAKNATQQALSAPNMMNAQTNRGQLNLAQSQFQQQLVNSQSYGQGYLVGQGGYTGSGSGSYMSAQQMARYGTGAYL